MKQKTLRWLWEVPGGKKLYILLLALTQAVHGASGVLYALLLRNVVDAAAEKDLPGFQTGAAQLILLVAAQLALRALLRWMEEHTRSTLENTFKRRLFRALLTRDYLAVSAVHSGEWLNRLTSDAVVVANSYVDILPGFAGMVVKLVSALGMIVALEPRFAALLLPVGALLVLFTWFFRKILKRLHKSVQETDGRLRIFLQERMGSMLMIRSFAAEEQTAADAEERMAGHKRARMRKNRFSNLCNIGFGAAMNGIYIVGVLYCGHGILTGRISYGTLTAVTQLISQIQTPFANITGYLPRYYAMLASAERLMEAENLPAGGPAARPAAEMDSFYHQRLTAFGLRDACFTYYPSAEGAGSTAIEKDNMPVVLERLSLTIRRGETVAFTGQSGCGKSTALKLLMCVYEPDAGERFYETDQDRGPLTAEHRRLFAYVPQGNQLMSGTIRQIVSFSEPGAAGDEERLRRALVIACADFVDELDRGVDTLLGERGTGLSEGQMQRLAIARAIFSDSPILLLDESTSALDADTERRLLENIRRMTDKTVVIVTHRDAALSICDRVLRFTEAGAEEVTPPPSAAPEGASLSRNGAL